MSRRGPASPARDGVPGAAPDLPTMIATLESLRQVELLDDLDVELARFAVALDSGGGTPELALATALASQRMGAGQVCVDLRLVAGGPFCTVPRELRDRVGPLPVAPELSRWREALRGSNVVGRPGDGAATPLVLDASDRLYLRRYAEDEELVARDLRARGSVADGIGPGEEPELARAIETSFERDAAVDPMQRRAIETLLRRRLCVLSGGPGTGKTTTVVRALAALVRWEASRGRTVHIELAAPTGKAAARMRAAVEEARQRLETAIDTAALGAIPAEARTIHRLLGSRPGGFRHDRLRPLALDVLVLDEASMIDLSLMARVVDALPPEARLVLVGDRDQLAAVEPGSVLGEICPPEPADLEPADLDASDGRRTGRGPVPEPTAASLDDPARPLAASLVRLTRSFRFDDRSDIASLARAVRRGDVGAALPILQRNRAADGPHERALVWHEIDGSAATARRLDATLVAGFAPYVAAVARHAAPSELLRELDRFRVLGALRRGPRGVEALNRRVERLLRARGMAGAGVDPWYPGRPVLVTRNDQDLRLFNGDVGFVCVVPADAAGRSAPGASRRVSFPAGDGTSRDLAPVQLPEHETVFATTIHKSQGSEFDAVLLFLPDDAIGLATRELVYTGITRARRRVEIWASEETLRRAIASRADRSSGLRDALWGLDDR